MAMASPTCLAMRSHSNYLHLTNCTTTNQILSGHILQIYIISTVMLQKWQNRRMWFIWWWRNIKTNTKVRMTNICTSSGVNSLISVESCYWIWCLSNTTLFFLFTCYQTKCLLCIIFFSLKQYIRDVISNPEVLQLN